MTDRKLSEDLAPAEGIIRGVGYSLALWVIIGLMVWAFMVSAAEASEKHRKWRDKDEQGQVTQTQEARSRSEAESRSSAESNAAANAAAQGGQGGAGGAGGNAQATNDGVSTEISNDYKSESHNTNVVLVPNNNTANCMRVWGISFGTSEGAAGLGLPTRDASCDFEQAADDAAATGNHKIAWWWRCHKKNLYKTFMTNRSAAEARLACWNSMVEMIAPIDTSSILIPEEEYQELLMAQVQQEEIEQLEDRYAQQQNLIEELREEVDKTEVDKAELERLRKEAAQLRAAQKKEESEDAVIRAKFKARLVQREIEQEAEKKDE